MKKKTFIPTFFVLFGVFLVVYLLQNQTLALANPLLEKSHLPLEAPDFSTIELKHFMPAFEEGMRQQLEEVEKIASQLEEPSFDNTLVALEKSGELLRRVAAIFFNITSSNSSEEARVIEEKISPLLSSHADDIHLNRQLFDRIDALYQVKDQLGLSQEQMELLDKYYKSSTRAGVLLSEEKQQEIRQINARLAALETQFGNNLILTMKKRGVVVTDRQRLQGLSEERINDAAAAAELAGHAKGHFLIEIDNTSIQPILSDLSDRSLREEIWLASVNRAQGEEGDVDNRPLVLELATLRAKKAALLGYPNYAAYVLEDQMAGNSEQALGLLGKLVEKVKVKTIEEQSKLEELMRAEGLQNQLAPWDWSYYAEKVRRRDFDVDSAALKPYFSMESVLQNGVFYVMGELYGVSFVERKDLPVLDPAVRVFDVLSANKGQIGLFYLDPFRRDGKSGGAWMSSYRDQSRLLKRLPVVTNVLNIQPPAAGQPVLLTLDEAVTFFHEMGHAMHGLLSQVEYPSLSGTEVPRDFVEFPSTFHEDWAIQPTILSHYARHYQSGEPIPRTSCKKA